MLQVLMQLYVTNWFLCFETWIGARLGSVSLSVLCKICDERNLVSF